jgi:hypothetical protein
MNPRILALPLVALCLAGCSKSNAPNSAQLNQPTESPSSAPAPVGVNDQVQQKLRELAGRGATDCGRHEMRAQAAELTTTSNCALSAAKDKKAFYVGYDMPGMTTAIAGNAQGKLFAVQLQGSGNGGQLDSGACPAELRVASSGRVTCFTPGSMSLNGNDPHAGMPVKPGAANPHGGMGLPQPMAPPPSSNTRKN